MLLARGSSVSGCLFQDSKSEVRRTKQTQVGWAMYHEARSQKYPPGLRKEGRVCSAQGRRLMNTVLWKLAIRTEVSGAPVILRAAKKFLSLFCDLMII